MDRRIRRFQHLENHLKHIATAIPQSQIYQKVRFTKSVKSDCCTRIIRQPLGVDESRTFKLQTVP